MSNQNQDEGTTEVEPRSTRSRRARSTGKGRIAFVAVVSLYSLAIAGVLLGVFRSPSYFLLVLLGIAGFVVALSSMKSISMFIKGSRAARMVFALAMAIPFASFALVGLGMIVGAFGVAEDAGSMFWVGLMLLLIFGQITRGAVSGALSDERLDAFVDSFHDPG